MNASPHEFDFISHVRQRAASHPRLALGIGDDAALVRFAKSDGCLVTVDMLMEGVDFTIPPATARQIGWKSLAVNLSDLAAMAGKPVACVVSVALPRRGGFELGRGLMEGISECSSRFDVALAGGDTNTWDGPLVISITCLGDPVPPGPVRRSGALAGDWIMATGEFGGSITGKHLNFTPRVAEALALHHTASLHAMIDVSDGLAADLGHILEESRVGAVLDEGRIPISGAAQAAADGRTALEHALGDGEDFELLFTVSPTDGQALLKSPPCEVRLSHIGEITAGVECLLRTRAGHVVPLPATGWKHGFE
ncbi:MAG: thiamine-monophosphate kinase [Planctomycetia bacterium]|nr:thiamine-monophosphate kinase [Planctomycetia bacterium]